MFASSNGTDRRGFALPLALLALALVSAAMVASYSTTIAEIRVNSAMRAQNRAYHLAEAGLQEFYVRRTENNFCTSCVSDPAQADSEWTRVSLDGGYADVVAVRVRPERSNSEPALFFVRSTGVDTTLRLGGGGYATFAQRTVGQYASWGTGAPKAIAAVVTLNGFTNSTNGASSRITGVDGCSEEETIAGVTVPKGGQWSGSAGQPTGSPKVDSSQQIDALKDAIAIDWDGIINRDAIPADITIPPSSNYPSLFTWLLNPFYYPVIRVKSSYTLPRDGRGILIADSNLTLGSGVDWYGIILVGGKLTVSGTGTIAGAVVSGLNLMLPGAVNPANGTTSDNDLTQNSRQFEYNSCAIVSATSRLRRYFVLPNTWVDNVADW